jgi:K+-transporting ATPase ATPase A chain
VTGNGWLQIALFGAIVVLITRPIGGYMTRVFAGEWMPLRPLLLPVERLVYWCCGVDETEEQSWPIYAIALLFSGIAGFATLYAMERLQWYLPFNPQGQAGVEPVLAFNTFGQLCHQHELAVLCAGDDDGLPRPNGGAHGS